MRQPPSRPRNTRAIASAPAGPTPRKRAPRQPPPRCMTWTCVEPPPPTPMLTAEQVAVLQAAEEAAEQARSRRKPHRPRPPQQCTVGCGYYSASDQRVPSLRLRGHWLERLGFAIGSRLQIAVRQGGLVVTLADDG